MTDQPYEQVARDLASEAREIDNTGDFVFDREQLRAKFALALQQAHDAGMGLPAMAAALDTFADELERDGVALSDDGVRALRLSATLCRVRIATTENGNG